MGFSVSATFTVFFIAFLAIGSSIYCAIYNTFNSISNSIVDQHKMMVDAKQTAIAIIDITVTGKSRDHNLELTVENTGSTTLDPSKLSILIDGVLQVNTLASGAWFPKNTITISFQHLSSSIENHRIKIVTENGISVYGTYTTRK
jgi:archaellum component FlaF (FlaF/FlaG flagellin family)